MAEISFSVPFLPNVLVVNIILHIISFLLNIQGAYIMPPDAKTLCLVSLKNCLDLTFHVKANIDSVIELGVFRQSNSIFKEKLFRT